MSKSVYVRVVHDLEFLCSLLCNRTTALISQWDYSSIIFIVTCLQADVLSSLPAFRLGHYYYRLLSYHYYLPNQSAPSGSPHSGWCVNSCVSSSLSEPVDNPTPCNSSCQVQRAVHNFSSSSFTSNNN